MDGSKSTAQGTALFIALVMPVLGKGAGPHRWAAPWGVLGQGPQDDSAVPLTLVSLFIYLFIYLWLCWVFVSVRRLSPVAASGGHSSSRCAGLSLSRPLPLRSTGSRRAGSVIVAHGPSCSAASGIFPDQGSNLCPLHWQADSQPLRHQGSPGVFFKVVSSVSSLAIL